MRIRSIRLNPHSFLASDRGLVFTGSVNAPFLRVAKSVLRTVNLAKPTHSRFKFPAGDGGLCEYTLFHCAVLCDILGRVDWAA